MTRQETGAIMNILTTAYPRFYTGKEDLRRTMALWAELFAEDEVRLVAAAVKALIATDDKGFPPHIGAVKAKLRQLTQPEELGEAQAWECVRKALKNSLYHAREEFDALPPLVQQVVCAPEQLREWAMLEESTVQSVVASNVQRSYRAKAQYAREFAALPGDVQALARSVAQSLGGCLGDPALPGKSQREE